jgi:hypothetical protein
MISESIETKKIQPDIIHGFVLDRSTRQPVMWVNVAIVDSDETSLTNDKGEFKVLSWKKFPVTVKVEHESFEPVTLRVTCFHESLVIMLRRAYY